MYDGVEHFIDFLLMFGCAHEPHTKQLPIHTFEYSVRENHQTISNTKIKTVEWNGMAEMETERVTYDVRSIKRLGRYANSTL